VTLTYSANNQLTPKANQNHLDDECCHFIINKKKIYNEQEKKEKEKEKKKEIEKAIH
jgi:hypothetical protein